MSDTIELTSPEQTHVRSSLAPRKSDTVTKLLRRAKGVTLMELQQATDWQPHSVRAFLSRLRKKGAVILKEQRKSGETAYRLMTEKAAAESSDAAA